MLFPQHRRRLSKSNSIISKISTWLNTIENNCWRQTKSNKNCISKETIHLVQAQGLSYMDFTLLLRSYRQKLLGNIDLFSFTILVKSFWKYHHNSQEFLWMYVISDLANSKAPHKSAWNVWESSNYCIQKIYT